MQPLQFKPGIGQLLQCEACAESLETRAIITIPSIKVSDNGIKPWRVLKTRPDLIGTQRVGVVSILKSLCRITIAIP
ncbi:hypothetical protein DEU52_11866 [Ensifer adhaerens]|nr:hypothetical protein DEU52_11866 [Ensifer adhaerens]